MGRGSLDLVAHLLSGAARGPAMIDSRGAATSYEELRIAIDEGARDLERHFGSMEGRAVCVRCQAPASYLRAALMVLKAGAILVPLNPVVGEGAAHSHEHAVGAVATIRDAPENGPLVIDVAEARPVSIAAGTAIILPTSGSSGIPKRVQLGALGLMHNIDAILDYLPIDAYPRTGVVLPLSYSYGLVGQCFTTLRQGGTAILLSDIGFPAKQVEAMQELEVGGLSSVPASLSRLAAVIEDLPKESRPPLGYIASAGGPLSEVVRGALERAVPGARLFNQYGLTEASPRVTALSNREEAFYRGSVGTPISGIEVAILDGERVCSAGEIGELVVRGPSVMLGYLGDDMDEGHVLTPDGLRTGDLGYADADGYLYLAGRQDDLVNIAGERVSTGEIASVLESMKSVTSAHVVAKNDDILGYRIIAFVVAPSARSSDIRRDARASLTPARRPAKIFCLSSLPTNANGKLDRRALREWAQAETVPTDYSAREPAP